LTIINLSIGPIITGRTEIEGTMNCAMINDQHDQAKDLGASDDDLKYTTKWAKDECSRKKGMHDMEYTAFIFDIVIGFVCGLIGLLHLFDLKKDFVANTGLIGLGCGVVGFVLTFVYVIFNGLVYTQYYDDRIIKRDGDGIFAELEGNEYKCKYFDEKGNIHALIAKYSDLGKKQYNYNKDLIKSYEADEVKNCKVSKGCDPYDYDDTNDYMRCVQNQGLMPSIFAICNEESYTPPTGYFTYLSGSNTVKCNNLYVEYDERGIENKDISDRFLTALILSLIVCLANIGLALFGFLLFRAPSDF
jgi:uncharacterized membrane protein (DUF485 family)